MRGHEGLVRDPEPEAHADGGRVGLMDRIARAAAASARRPARETSSAAAPSAISDWRWRPNADVMRQLDLPAEAPDHVQEFGGFMAEQANRARAGDLGARDLIKAFAITRASIQRAGLPADRLRDVGLSVPGDASGMVRPEGAMAEWLATPAGQRYLDAAVRGEVDEGAVADAVARLAPFGKPTDIDDALRHGATALPGREAEAAQAIAGVYEGDAGLDDWRSFALGLRGIGPAKQGFIGSLLGAGRDPTLDARQLLLHTGAPTAEARPYLERRGGLGALQGADKLALRQEDMDLGLPADLEPFRQHLTHHAVWDRVGGSETTHEDVVRAMRLYGAGGAGAAVGFEGLVGGGDPAGEPERYQDGGRVGLARGALERAIRAYHGSPHRFDRFDLRRFGTGEGGGAYGHGLYFAESEDVARGYRDRLSRHVSFNGRPVADVPGGPGDPQWAAVRAVSGRVANGEDPAAAIAAEVAEWRAYADPFREALGDPDLSVRRAAQREVYDFERIADAVAGLRAEAFARDPGHLYEVRLHVDPANMLDFDARLDAQPRAVQAAFERSGIPASSGWYGRQAHQLLADRHNPRAWDESDPHLPFREVTRELREAGIPGIRYLDSGSRGGGQGTSNFVMFDDAPIEIVRRYASGGLADAPGYAGGGRVEALRGGLGAVLRAAEGVGGGGGRAVPRPSPEVLADLPRLAAVDPLEFDGAQFPDRARQMEEWFRRNLQGQMIEAEALGGRPVHIVGNLSGKLRRHPNDDLFRSLRAVPSIIRGGGLYWPSTEAVPQKPSERLIHYLGAHVPVGGRDELLRLVVREAQDGYRATHDFGSLGAARRDPIAPGSRSDEVGTGGASQHGPRRAAQQGAEGLEVKPEDGEEGPVRYADGGRVGIAAGAAGALAKALREGVAARTRQNPRGLPMDEASRRARAESMGFDLDRRYLHATHADFEGFDPAMHGSGANAALEGERAVWLTDGPPVADSYLGGYHVALENFPDAVPLDEDVGRLYHPSARVMPVVMRNRDDMTAWDMGGARYSPEVVERIFQDARAESAPGAIMENFRDPGMFVAGPLGNGSRPSEVVAVFDPTLLRSPHATFDPERAHESDLLAGVGALGAGVGAATAFEGLARGEDEPVRYAEGGRVGIAAGAAGALAKALREGVAPRTRQNPRGLPMDEASRRTRAESLGFDLDDVRYHGTPADTDFRGFRQTDRGVWSATNPEIASMYAMEADIANRARMRPDGTWERINTSSRVIPLVSRAQQVQVLPQEDGDRLVNASNYQRAQAEVFRRARARGADALAITPGVRVDLDARNLRSPHATFDPERSREADLLAGVGAGMAGSLAAFEGLVGGEGAEPVPRYANGGLAEREPGWLEGLAAAAGPAALGIIGSVVRRRPPVQRGLPTTEGFRPVFPQPQRMMPEGERVPGGRYLEAPRRDPASGQMVGEDITGQTRGAARVEIGPDGRPAFLTSPEGADPVEAGHRVRTNLFRRSAGWDWVGEPPAGAADHPFLVSVETGNRHHYALGTDFEGPVTMARYPRATSEPRLRPTTRGDVELGQQVGTISVRGVEHPVYDRVYVVRPGDEVEPAPRYADGGLADASGYADGGRVGGRSRLVEEFLREMGPQVKAAFRRYALARPIGVGVPGADVAESVLRDGRLRTQFETGTSEGLLDPELRAQREQALLGLPLDLPHQNRPVYGALRSADPIELGFDEADTSEAWVEPAYYGDHVFLLRPEAKARSSFTIGDSLDDSLVPRAYGFDALDVSPRDLVARATRGAQYGEARAAELLADTQRGMGRSASGWAPHAATGSYIETQTRGPVSTDEVAALLVPNPWDVDRLRDLTRKRGVEIYQHRLVASDPSLQRRLGLRAAGAGLGLGALMDGEDEAPRYAAGGLAGAAGPMAANPPGPDDELAATQGAAMRGLQQAQRMWEMAGGLAAR